MPSDGGEQKPLEIWIVPVVVYDEVTANDTAGVLRGIGYQVGSVEFKGTAPAPDAVN